MSFSMRRAALGPSLIAVVATWGAAIPATWLFQDAAWLQRGIATGLAVVALGAVLRGMGVKRAGIPPAQLLVWLVLVLREGAADTLLRGLIPTGETLGRLGELGRDALNVVATNPAPAPATASVVFWLVAAVSLLAVAVDAVAVTREAPAAAGFPLLLVFLAAAANRGGDAVPWPAFLIPLGGWLVLLVRQSYQGISGWSTTHAHRIRLGELGGPDSDLAGMRSFARMGRVVALLGIAAAVLLPAFTPHLPPRFVASGLGRSDAPGGSVGVVGFSSTVDLDRQLRTVGGDPVLIYRTNAILPEPVKVVTASVLRGDRWQGRSTVPGDAAQTVPPVTASDASVTTFEVEANGVAAPHLAAPQPVTGVDGVAGLAVDPANGDLFVSGDQPRSYRVTYLQRSAAATGQALPAAAAADTGDGGDDLRLPAASADLVRGTAKAATAGASTPFAKAVAIQNYLREGTRFHYTLTPQRLVGADMVTSFLTGGEGYCTHFATAMVLMARAEGIPARMALGFLPGTSSGGTYTVRGSDAHAWPELRFAGIGWVRFEPTPGARSGPAPAYTAPATPVNPAPATPPLRAEQRPDRDGDPGAGGPLPEETWWSGLRSLVTPERLWGAGVTLAVVALALLMPITRALTARRRTRRQDERESERVERAWAELVGDLRDLGLQVPAAATLRGAERHIAREGHLDDADRATLHRVVATVEHIRYARPADSTSGSAALDGGAAAVRRAVAGSRSRRSRLRAWWWPSREVAWWRARIGGATGRLGAATRRAVGAVRTFRRR